MKFSLEINEKQARAILKALEFYERLSMGQVNELAHHFISPFSDKINDENKYIIEEMSEKIKKEVFPELDSNSSFGIFSKNVSDDAKIMYDIQQVLRHCVAWSKNPSGDIFVDYDTPLQSSKEDMPVAKKIKMSDDE